MLLIVGKKALQLKSMKNFKDLIRMEFFFHILIQLKIRDTGFQKYTRSDKSGRPIFRNYGKIQDCHF